MKKILILLLICILLTSTGCGKKKEEEVIKENLKCVTTIDNGFTKVDHKYEFKFDKEIKQITKGTYTRITVTDVEIDEIYDEANFECTELSRPSQLYNSCKAARNGNKVTVVYDMDLYKMDTFIKGFEKNMSLDDLKKAIEDSADKDNGVKYTCSLS